MTQTYTYGVARPDQVAGLSGKQILQRIIDGSLPQPPICQTLTFWLTEVGDGFAAFEGEPGPHLLNPMGGVHGGWVLTLIDSVTGCAANSLLPAGTGYTTIETKGNFSRPISAGSGRRCFSSSRSSSAEVAANAAAPRATTPPQPPAL